MRVERYYLYRCGISSTMDRIIKIYSREVWSIFVSEISKYYTRTWNRLYLFYSYIWKQRLHSYWPISIIRRCEVYLCWDEYTSSRQISNRIVFIFKRHIPLKKMYTNKNTYNNSMRYNYLFYLRIFLNAVCRQLTTLFTNTLFTRALR